ncbi:MAG: glycosyltransferase [Planctomycetota bacterium]|nr:glycosyltransferase [Planctomycetota bacterium]MEC8651621.1 glycosyltransferase [Planctomycetota bacterium]MEC9048053.1 glycosyltransferase [Planctomycetota bacterium]
MSVTVSAVVPVLDGKHQLERSLPPLLAAKDAGQLLEVLVADDGSADGSGDYARALGATVVTTDRRASGPSLARNVAAAQARGDVLLFVDADVVVDDDAVRRVRATFDDPAVGSVYGSYDDAPDHRGYASLYMNLRHHFGHRGRRDDVDTFWAGLGAIRRDVFDEVGGYDVDAFPYPSVEDIDLGRRLRAAGAKIRRDPEIRGKHLKRWTWWQVMHTDVMRRAAPWSRLMRQYPGAFRDLNVSHKEKFKALLALAFVVSGPLAALGLAPLWAWLVCAAGIAVANAGLMGVFLRCGGPLFAVVGVVFHQLHLCYSAATFVACRLLPLPR